SREGRAFVIDWLPAHTAAYAETKDEEILYMEALWALESCTLTAEELAPSIAYFRSLAMDVNVDWGSRRKAAEIAQKGLPDEGFRRAFRESVLRPKPPVRTGPQSALYGLYPTFLNENDDPFQYSDDLLAL